MLIDEPGVLIEGKKYRFTYRNSRNTGHRLAFFGEASPLKKDTFRFQGIKHDKYVFQHTVGDWTISLSRNQLIGLNFKEVKNDKMQNHQQT